jgi:hypothetical protein
MKIRKKGNTFIVNFRGNVCIGSDLKKCMAILVYWKVNLKGVTYELNNID